MPHTPSPSRTIAIIGTGPAGLIAADHLSALGHRVVLFDQMASPARKFLMAGRGGLNLTHAEPFERILSRYGGGGTHLADALTAFPPQALRAWADGLGAETFVGSSGRVFPRSFKATPLLRAWLARLAGRGVTAQMRHRWTGWGEDGSLCFDTPAGPVTVTPAATLLALGGASWPRLGTDGRWVETLSAAGLAITPLAPSNCGVCIDWSAHLRDRHAGDALKGCAFSVGAATSRGEANITARGLEGGAIYALSGAIRSALHTGAASLHVDLKPDVSLDVLATRLAEARAGDSLSNTLRKRAGLTPAAISLLREATPALPRDSAALAALIKAVPLTLTGIDSLDRAISTAGGLAFAALTPDFMLAQRPGTFVAGEMLDWDAPTGGYLLSACFATGMAAARGIERYLRSR